ncbi:SAM-dependent methyltransferase [Streptomyces sp. NPDC000609]|uniref:SAM-dependent methyltransferase n=1 Tax=Streptomyces sp. NPDC000609 TaxID=3160957 RepID=UPI00339AA53E
MAGVFQAAQLQVAVRFIAAVDGGGRNRCSPIPRCGKTLDLSRPIAVVMNAVLHFIPDDRRPDHIVRAYLDQAAPGSYLALTHAAPDPTHPDEQNAMLADYQKLTGAPFTNRTPEQIAAWLDGLQIQPPRLVPRPSGSRCC